VIGTKRRYSMPKPRFEIEIPRMIRVGNRIPPAKLRIAKIPANTYKPGKSKK